MHECQLFYYDLDNIKLETELVLFYTINLVYIEVLLRL